MSLFHHLDQLLEKNEDALAIFKKATEGKFFNEMDFFQYVTFRKQN